MADIRPVTGGESDSRLTRELAAELTAAAERRWGVARAAALADAIEAAAATLAHVAAVELADDEPDFVR